MPGNEKLQRLRSELNHGTLQQVPKGTLNRPGSESRVFPLIRGPLRHRNDYVRVKIACRDVMQVPTFAESTLGMMIYDFFYERESPEEAQTDALKIMVSAKTTTEQPLYKKPRMEESTNNETADTSKNMRKSTRAKDDNYKKCSILYSSALWPRKMSSQPPT